MNSPPETDTAANQPDATGAQRDEALMESLQCGDELALTALMSRWETGIKIFLLRLGVPGGDVEDIAQETFIRVYEKRAAYRAGSAFKPWILTIAGNLGRNRLRWRWRRREESIDAASDVASESVSMSVSEGFHGAASADAGGDVGTLVRAAVNALPDKLRRAVVCVELEDLSYIEAAQVIGCTPKAIETRLYRARELLRRRLQGIAGEDA